MRAAMGLVLLLAVGPSGRLAAQDTTRLVLPADTLRPGVRPMGAFWRSFLLPGWGQAVTDRKTTGAAFVAWEGVTAMMTLKAQQEANYFKSIHSQNLKLKRQEVQAFLDYIFDNEVAIANRSDFISLTPKQLKRARTNFLLAVKAANRT